MVNCCFNGDNLAASHCQMMDASRLSLVVITSTAALFGWRTIGAPTLEGD
jgi:hypothetical protein